MGWMTDGALLSHSILYLYVTRRVDLWYKDTNGSVKRRYWQQVWQLHVKGVAMVTVHSQLSHPLPSSLSVCLFHSLFCFFLVLVISSHTSGQLCFAVVALCCNWQKHHSNIRSITTLVISMHQQKISQNTHLQESDTGNGIMPSYPDSSFPQSTVIGEEKSLSEPRADNHILTREIIVFSSRAGQLRVSDTNVTLLYASLPYMLRSSSACMLIAFPWTLIRRECRPPFKSLEITTGTFLHNLRFSG